MGVNSGYQHILFDNFTVIILLCRHYEIRRENCPCPHILVLTDCNWMKIYHIVQAIKCQYLNLCKINQCKFCGVSFMSIYNCSCVFPFELDVTFGFRAIASRPSRSLAFFPSEFKDVDIDLAISIRAFWLLCKFDICCFFKALSSYCIIMFLAERQEKYVQNMLYDMHCDVMLRARFMLCSLHEPRSSQPKFTWRI